MTTAVLLSSSQTCESETQRNAMGTVGPNSLLNTWHHSLSGKVEWSRVYTMGLSAQHTAQHIFLQATGYS